MRIGLLADSRIQHQWSAVQAVSLITGHETFSQEQCHYTLLFPRVFVKNKGWEAAHIIGRLPCKHEDLVWPFMPWWHTCNPRTGESQQVESWDLLAANRAYSLRSRCTREGGSQQCMVSDKMTQNCTRIINTHKHTHLPACPQQEQKPPFLLFCLSEPHKVEDLLSQWRGLSQVRSLGSQPWPRTRL